MENNKIKNTLFIKLVFSVHDFKRGFLGFDLLEFSMHHGLSLNAVLWKGSYDTRATFLHKISCDLKQKKYVSTGALHESLRTFIQQWILKHLVAQAVVSMPVLNCKILQ